MARSSGYLRRLARDLRRPWGTTARPSPANRALQQAFEARAKELFARQTSDAGRRWKPLAETTRRSKRGHQILVETGTLRQSLTARGNRFAVRRVQGRTLVLGTRVPYAARVNRERPFLPFQAQATRKAAVRQVVRALIRGR